MSRRFGLDVDFKEVKEVHLDIDGHKTMVLPVNGPINSTEALSASQFVNFHQLLREGPFYSGPIAQKSVGVDDGIKRHGDKYMKKVETRKMAEYPFKKEFFPKELRDVIDAKKSKIKLTSYKLGRVVGSKNDEEYQQQVLEKLKSIATADEEKVEDNVEEEEEEDDFDDDDDDDYNAEKYFDDGEDFGEEGDEDEEAAF